MEEVHSVVSDMLSKCPENIENESKKALAKAAKHHLKLC